MTSLEENQIITSTFHRLKTHNNVTIWYRTAGWATNPTILLLHGFPTSSNMFRNLIPLLALNFHVIAPDLPGYGFTETPRDFDFSFAGLTDAMEQFLDALEISKFYLYVFDYGAPVGFRLAMKNPSSITGIVVQNGNAYEEGIDDRFWGSIKKYWNTDQKDPTFVQTFTKFLQDPDNTVSQYKGAIDGLESVDPSGYTLDISLLSRPGQFPIQIKLFHDYKSNVELYPEFQKFLRNCDIPVLVTWGKNDTIFTVEGAESYRKDAKCLKIVYYETGHFALETHVAEIADEITNYFHETITR